MNDTYCTTFCNKGHRLSDGKPVAHECYVLDPDALKRERDGRTVGQIVAVPRRTHRGVKAGAK